MEIESFPPLNAALNGLSAVLLAAGFVAIRAGRRRLHAGLMVAALVSSTAFLACYLTYHAMLKGHVTRFPAEYPAARAVYLTILISHTLLAIVNLPMIVVTVLFAARRNFEKHRSLARWTLPVWFYISVTGVLIYLMLYRWFPPKDGAAPVTASAAPRSAALARATATGELRRGVLVFTPDVSELEADPEQREIATAFTIENTGPSPVKITKLDSSCSCLSVEADSMEIPPGGKSTVTAVFDIGKSTGETEKSVYVTTDDPLAAEVRLPVKIRVPSLFEITPNITEWPLGGSPEPRTIAFKVLREKPVHVLEATSSRRQVTAKLETVAEGREYRVVLTPESTADTLLGFVKIVTDCELEQHRQQMAFFAVKAPDNPK